VRWQRVHEAAAPCQGRHPATRFDLKAGPSERLARRAPPRLGVVHCRSCANQSARSPRRRGTRHRAGCVVSSATQPRRCTTGCGGACVTVRAVRGTPNIRPQMRREPHTGGGKSPAAPPHSIANFAREQTARDRRPPALSNGPAYVVVRATGGPPRSRARTRRSGTQRRRTAWHALEKSRTRGVHKIQQWRGCRMGETGWDVADCSSLVLMTTIQPLKSPPLAGTVSAGPLRHPCPP